MGTNQVDGLLSGKVALVTGAGSGIGAAAAHRLAGEGARVGVLSRTASEVGRVADEICTAGADAIALTADVTQVDQMDQAIGRMIEKWGRLDVVVASAGVNGVWAPVEDLTPEEWDTTMAINLKGTFLTVRQSVPLLRKEGGSIVLISSIQGVRVFSHAGSSAYAASKAGQVAFGRIMALELARDGIRVNTICPGAIRTRIIENTERRNLESIRFKRSYPEGAVPLTGGEAGTSEQVADSVAYLASDASSHITGTEIFIDGGESLVT